MLHERHIHRCTSVLVTVTAAGNNPGAHKEEDGLTNQGRFRQQRPTQTAKGLNHLHKDMDEISKILCCVKEGLSKKVHTIWFYLFEVQASEGHGETFQEDKNCVYVNRAGSYTSIHQPVRFIFFTVH